MDFLTAKPPYPGTLHSDEKIDCPIKDLSIFEVIFLYSLIKNKSYENLSKTITNTPLEFKKYLLALVKDNTGKDVPFEELEIEEESQRWYLDYIVANFILDAFGDYGDAKIFKTSALRELVELNPLFKNTSFLRGMPVTVDLRFDDKTLINTFKEWLIERRKESGNKFKKAYTEKDFDDWFKYRILQVFDLDLWADVTGYKITDPAIAKALWPDDSPDADDVSPIDRLRKVSRLKIKILISSHTINSLRAQAAFE